MNKQMNAKWNKRADITITVLVIGVFALCSLALFSFYYSSTDVVRNPSLGLDLMERMNSQLEKYNSPQHLHGNFETLLEVKKDVQGNNFFILEKEDDGKVVFRIKYYLD